MNILIVEPGKRPYAKEISGDLESLQQTVGGYIQAIYPFDDPIALVCEEEALYHPEQKWNRIVDCHTVIKGTFFICGLGEEDFTALSPELTEKYKQRFWNIEYFVQTPGGLMPIILRETDG